MGVDQFKAVWVLYNPNREKYAAIYNTSVRWTSDVSKCSRWDELHYMGTGLDIMRVLEHVQDLDASFAVPVVLHIGNNILQPGIDLWEPDVDFLSGIPINEVLEMSELREPDEQE